LHSIFIVNSLARSVKLLTKLLEKFSRHRDNKDKDFDPSRRELVRAGVVTGTGILLAAALSKAGIAHAQLLQPYLTSEALISDSSAKLPFVRAFRDGSKVVVVREDGTPITEKTDHYYAIQEAIDAGYSEYGNFWLVINHGYYKLDNPLVMKPGVRISGVTNGIYPVSPDPSVEPTPSKVGTFLEFEIPTDEYAIKPESLSGCYGMMLENLIIRTTGHGIQWSGGGSRINNVYVIKNKNYEDTGIGFHITSPSTIHHGLIMLDHAKAVGFEYNFLIGDYTDTVLLNLPEAAGGKYGYVFGETEEGGGYTQVILINPKCVANKVYAIWNRYVLNVLIDGGWFEPPSPIPQPWIRLDKPVLFLSPRPLGFFFDETYCEVNDKRSMLIDPTQYPTMRNVYNASVEVGLNDTYGTPLVIKPSKPFFRLVLLRARVDVTGTFQTGETITVAFRVYNIDGTYVERTKQYTSAAYDEVSSAFLADLQSGNPRITKIEVLAKTNMTSTSVTVTLHALVLETI